MGESKRRKKLEPNYGKPAIREITVLPFDEKSYSNYDGHHQELKKIWQELDALYSSLELKTIFFLPVQIDGQKYDTFYELEAQNQGNNLLLLNKIFFGGSIEILGTSKRNQIKYAREIKTAIIEKFLSRSDGLPGLSSSFSQNQIVVKKIVVFPTFVIF